ncbi:TetR/AcrR family transcriptional regulator, transcriptional repressor for nem operon [Pararobbsia alpina]|uniref:TetR/AcrR family transcriptional regulator n=1 Tax=Pararobbsia alpina TaxID=621374 RepID=UPI0039A43580
MTRPREFDRDEALNNAMRVFWQKGFAATSTDDLLAAMNIGRQSLYNTFGSKRELYLEALDRYQQESVSGHVRRLKAASTPVAGLESMLLGVIARDERERTLGCMGVNSVCEHGADDEDLASMRAKMSGVLLAPVVERIREGQQLGEIDASLDAQATAMFVLTAMQGLQLNARGGLDAKTLRSIARFAIDRIRSR